LGAVIGLGAGLVAAASFLKNYRFFRP
jgi:hypothetical protein